MKLTTVLGSPWLDKRPAEEKRIARIGKTSIKHKGKSYRRWRRGYSPNDKRHQKETSNPKAFLCECGEKWGKYHDLGCDLEQCPICKGQLLSCGHGELFETGDARCR